MALGTLVRFRLAWAAARNLPGTVLRQHPSAEGCSVDEVSHLAIRPLFVSERETQRQAKALRLSSTRRALPERFDRPSQPASPYEPYLRGCWLVVRNCSSGSAPEIAALEVRRAKDSRLRPRRKGYAIFMHALQSGSCGCDIHN